MGFTVQHQPSAAAVANAGYNIGVGEKQQRQTERADRALQAAANRNMRRYEFDKDYELRQRSADRQDKYYDALGKKFEQEAMLQLEKMNQQKRLSKLALQKPEFTDTIAMRKQLNDLTPPKYTPAQQKRLDELRLVQDYAKQKYNSGEWDQDQARQVIEQAEMEFLNIKPVDKTNNDFVPEEEFINNVAVDPFTGERWLMNNGKWENITPKSQKEGATVVDQANAQKDLLGVKLDLYKEWVNAGNMGGLEEFNEFYNGFLQDGQKPQQQEAQAPVEARDDTMPSGYKMLAPESSVKTLMKNPQDIMHKDENGNYKYAPYFTEQVAKLVAKQRPDFNSQQVAQAVMEFFKKNVPEFHKQVAKSMNKKTGKKKTATARRSSYSTIGMGM